MSDHSSWKHAPSPVRGGGRRIGGGTLVGLIALLVVAVIGVVVVLDPYGVSGSTIAAPGRSSATSVPSASPSAGKPVSPDTPAGSSTATPKWPAGIPTGFPTPVTLPTPTQLPSSRSSEELSSPGQPTGDQEKPLVANRLYARSLDSADCKQGPKPAASTDAAYRRFLQRMFDCLADVYREPLRQAGFTLTTPYLVFFSDRMQTPCGMSPTELSVFYCSANETVYATRKGLDDYSAMRLGLYYVVFHEYAHHVQERAGILDAARFRHEDWPQISRRIELQAECMMGITLRTVRSARFSGTDLAELHAWRARVPDEQHGSGVAQIAWIDRGLDTRSLARCNTWNAPLYQVQ